MKTELLTKQERLALQFDPFAGDESTATELRDEIVTNRKSHECHQCGWKIKPGERVRVIAEICEGRFMESRWCQLCTESMGEIDDAKFSSRENIHRKKK